MTGNGDGWSSSGVADSPIGHAAAGRLCGVAAARAGSARLVALAAMALVTACGAAEPDADNLKVSFGAQIESVASVSAFERDGDALAFTETRADGDEVRWRVTIESAVVARPAGNAPIQGHVVSFWYADGELIERLGSMSRLPDAFLDAGIAQECYGLWDAEAGGWDW